MQYEPSYSGQSVLRIGDIEVRYYVREPSPDKWNVIGIISSLSELNPTIEGEESRLIVGVGPSRDEAIGDLIARVLSAQHPVLTRYRRGHATPEQVPQ